MLIYRAYEFQANKEIYLIYHHLIYHLNLRNQRHWPVKQYLRNLSTLYASSISAFATEMKLKINIRVEIHLTKAVLSKVAQLDAI